MIPVLLVDALAGFLAEANKDYRLTDAKVRDNPLIVSPGWLKIRESADERPFPHIVPRPVATEDGADGVSFASVRIYFGTYCEDAAGAWRELFNLMERSRQALLKTRTIANKYCLKLPLKAVIPEEQPYPEWVGYIDAQYIIAQIQEEFTYGE